MPEHTIPSHLLEQLRSGKAILVVGSGVGLPSWKQLLETMTQTLSSRGREGDDAAVKDLEKLLHKGSLVRALGFLARQLGEDACDKLVEATWKTPGELPPVATLLAQLPFRHVWTTFPGDLLERAWVQASPGTWPEPRVHTYRDVSELSPRRRALVKLLGNFDNYVVTPKSVRRALSHAVDLRDYARPYYVDGTLVFVGFRHGDPDLAALLDRVLSSFEHPQGTHYFLGAGVGPVTVDELKAEHHIEVISLDGKAGGEDSSKSLTVWLERLIAATKEAGISLSSSQPEAGDLDGWLELYHEGDPDARDALVGLEAAARRGADHEKLTAILLAKAELASEDGKRAEALCELAGIYEANLADTRRAFDCWTTAIHINPGDEAVIGNAERLAAVVGGWSELAAEGVELATEIKDPSLAAMWWSRLGGYYLEKLDRYDYAATSLRRAIELDPSREDAHARWCELLRRQQKWVELADAISARAEIISDDSKKADLFLSLGDLCENQLASTSRAIAAYDAALSWEQGSAEALAALTRLYRRDEKWGNLAKSLEQLAVVVEQSGDAAQASTLRREISSLRVEKLGDLEGAITKHEETLRSKPDDVGTLTSLEELYDKTGRSSDYLRVLERLAKIGTDVEKLRRLRRLASELEDRDGELDRAVSAWDQIIALDPKGDDSYRGLARLYQRNEKWYELIAVYERHIAAQKTPSERVSLFLDMAKVYENELSDPHRALEAYQNALALDRQERAAAEAVARLYQRIESWDRAVDALEQIAATSGELGVGSWADAARISHEHLDDKARAERNFEHALALAPTHLPSLRGLANLYEASGRWSLAVDTWLRAEQSASARTERVAHLSQAANLLQDKLQDGHRAMNIRERILKVDPENLDVAGHVVDLYLEKDRFEDAAPVLEMIVRRSAQPAGEGSELDQPVALDRFDRARRHAQLGKCYDELHRSEKAAEHYRHAVELDSEQVEAALGLANALLEQADARTASGPEQAAGLYAEVDKRYREILARHRTALADSQVAEIWLRLGRVSDALGDEKKAEASFRRALERDPTHAATWQAMSDLAQRRSDWKGVIEAQRALLANEEPAEQMRRLEQIGDIARHKQNDVAAALGAYREALAIRQNDTGLLNKLLEVYTEKSDWRRAVDALDALAMAEASPIRRSKFRYAAAVIARDELRDAELAIERFSAALDDEPGHPKAFEASEKLMIDRQDWKGLARGYRKVLKRLGDEASVEKQSELWSKLADVCLDHLGDNDSAMAALEVCVDLQPTAAKRREQLAELYLGAGADKRPDAIAELQALLAMNPDRVEIYKTLSSLYRETGEIDKAWCVAAALVFLGAASPEETAFYQKHRPTQLATSTRRLTEELWQKSVWHAREDRHVSAILAAVSPHLVAKQAQAPSAFGLDATQRLEGEDGLYKMVKYGASVLGLDNTPQVWKNHEEGVRYANTIGVGDQQNRAIPSILISTTIRDEREILFEIGKRLAYLRPERLAALSMPSAPVLESALISALIAAGTQALTTTGQEVGAVDGNRQLSSELQKSLPEPVLAHVATIGHRLSGRLGNGLVTGWRTGTDMTANRAGLVLSGDLEAAARVVARETGSLSSLGPKERLRDLLAYSVSEEYFAVRRYLGLEVAERARA
ncbi:MAG: tetratricopeptide repeat protein [Myxococcales bacterium]|nr:tetratricopeptide repeat protein [Myxococcales bacterium]